MRDRFTPRKATPDRQRTSQPGESSPEPAKTIDVLNGASGGAGGQGSRSRASQTKRGACSCSSSTDSRRTVAPYSSAASGVPMAPHGSPDSATDRTASAVEEAG